jgi:uncharacterized damage-inducible protein DinB
MHQMEGVNGNRFLSIIKKTVIRRMRMNFYCKGTLHQIEVAVTSIIEIMDRLTDEDLDKRPTSTKHSVGELLSHIALICRADYIIATGAAQEELESYYSSKTLNTLAEMKEELINNFNDLKERVSCLSDEMLKEETSSFWGVTYTKFEWLIEITAHLYHHRGQLHGVLVHCYDRDPAVSLFE